ncbi:hypothetical protein [Aeromonas jandaei]|uniref:hypothetical protein n=1 Tax=Aeromonas jandaei TaxID=650 RepID=UPI003B9E9828
MNVELDRILCRDFESNKEMLVSLKEKLDLYLTNKIISNYEKNLYSSDIDDEWLSAQFKAASNQISKIIDKKSLFNQCYIKILTDQDLVLLTQEIIFDLCILNQMSGNKLMIDNRISRSNFISSHQFFLHAKFSYFTKKSITETTTRNFNFSSMPTLIRQAIELKVKNMIGLESITNQSGGFKFIPISKILMFFTKNKNLIHFPVSIETLSYINLWTNSFVHSGIVPFCWQSLEAIDLISEFFKIKDNDTGIMNVHGFTLLYKGVSLAQIEDALNNEFQAIFKLEEKNIEGQILYK